MLSIFTLLILIVCVRSIANPAVNEYNSRDHFLKQASLKNQKMLFQRTGDLNSDGLEDWVIVLSKDRAEEVALIKLVVLTKLPTGHFSESVSSMEVEDYYRLSSTSSFDFEIKNSSIYFEVSAHTYDEIFSTVFQFKLYNGVWRLVGKKTSSSNVASGENTDDDFSKVEDVNMLSGFTISKVVRGNKKSERRFTKKIKTYFLKDFDFSGTYGAP